MYRCFLPHTGHDLFNRSVLTLAASTRAVIALGVPLL